jgi:hypothetical protein
MKALVGFVFVTVLSLVRADVITAIAPQSTTQLVMGVGVVNGIVAIAGPSHVRVPPGENVLMALPESWTYPIQWTKNGKPIAGATGRAFGILVATSGDSATYSVTGAPFPFAATGIMLDVVPTGHLGNQSARVELAPNVTQVIGFVVGGASSKNLLFRAVGPTLTAFGVAKPAPRPVIRCYDGAGREFGFVHPAVVIDVNALFKSVGAFPLTDAELTTVSFDYGPFAPGAYSLHVTDSTGGTALVEVYEMP